MNTNVALRLAAAIASGAVTTLLLLAIALNAYPPPDTGMQIAQSPVAAGLR